MNQELKKRILTSIFLIILLFLMVYYNYIFVISIIIISVITWVEFNFLIFKIYKNKLLRFVICFLILSYITLFAVFLAYGFLSESQNSKIYILYLIGVCVVTDIGGYVFGKIFKGKKLSKISPNKTISGSIGSFLLSFIFMVIISSILSYDFIIQLTVITLLVSLSSQLGDLFISYLKRKAKVKNTSNILPGHGGVLDRIDGIIFAVPFGVIISSIII